MTFCEMCEKQAERQGRQLQPREVREGIVMLLRSDALGPVAGKPVPDVRMGDIVRVTLIGGAVEDMGWCSDQQCDNYRA